MTSKKEERPLYVGRIIAAFIIATIIFLGGFFASNYLSVRKYDQIDEGQEKLKFDLFSLQLQKDILTSSCKNFKYREFSRELDKTGKYLNILEKRLGKMDEKVLEQKKIYSMLEAQHFLFIKEHNKNCEEDFPTILFFYSNKEDYADMADQMGFILGTVKSKNGDVMVYSFDYDLDSDVIDALETRYNVTGANTLVINEDTKLTNVQNIREIEEVLGEK